ncbi:conserved domain protein [Verrucomicrobiia bacterium DG1235]|nr:conserved domain protein [Verrucomicrobiae bacterium DG1235]
MKIVTISLSHFSRIVQSSLLTGVFVLTSQVFAAGPTVSNVTAQQRPNTKLVDITYDLEHDEDLASTVTIEATADGENWTLLTNLTSSSAHGFGVVEGTGKSVVWAAEDEWPAQLFPAVKVRVRANDGTGGGVDPANFSLVPGGVFAMGSPNGEVGRDAVSEVLHDVTLNKSFYMAKTEVTWSDWSAVRAFATANGYSDIGVGANGSMDAPEGDHPVSNVSWWDAVKYCNARSEQEGKTPVYYTEESLGAGNVLRTGTAAAFADLNANGYRLPTDAEWEYACRAGTETGFYTGEVTQSNAADPNLDSAGWYAENSGDNTHAAAGKAANAWGLYDTHGNVWEWCWDWYSQDLSVGELVDPTGAAEPNGNQQRVIRGGGYLDPAENCRSARRFRFRNTSKDVTLGFRVAVTSVQ